MSDYAKGREDTFHDMLERVGSLELALAALSHVRELTTEAVRIIASEEGMDRKIWNELLDTESEITSKITDLRVKALDQRRRLNLALTEMLETGGREGSQ